MTFIKGVDVSSYQPAVPSTSTYDFMFIKVTEGLTYVNPRWASQRDTARKAGLVVGYYAYPHMANSPQAEADFFLRQVAWQPGDIAVLDWEGYDAANTPVPKSTQRAYKDAWLAYVKSKIPHNPVIMYANIEYWRNVDTNGNCGDGLWIADYSKPAGQPGIASPWIFHQHLSTPIDTNVANFPTRDALRAWTLSFQPKPVPAPKPAPPVSPATKPIEVDMPQQMTGSVTPGDSPTVVLPPCGLAWAAYPNRKLHLGYDAIGTPGATAQVRVYLHDGNAWTAPPEADASTGMVTVSAGTGRLDLTMTSAVQKISLQTSSHSVVYAVESW